MNYWLMKSEPESFSIDNLMGSKDKTTHWDGIRNYQARNFMRDDMRTGDRILFYHSNCDEPAVVGIAEVAGEPYPDHTAFDHSSKYYDPKSDPDNPRWVMVDVRFIEKFRKPVTLRQIKSDDRLTNMALVRKGMRLSIQPVSADEFRIITEMA